MNYGDAENASSGSSGVNEACSNDIGTQTDFQDVELERAQYDLKPLSQPIAT